MGKSSLREALIMRNSLDECGATYPESAGRRAGCNIGGQGVTAAGEDHGRPACQRAGRPRSSLYKINRLSCISGWARRTGISLQLHLNWLADDAERRALIAAHTAAALISADLPLRANLTVLDNIALIPQFRHNLNAATASAEAWELLLLTGHEGCALKRDPQLDHAERFVAKLLRAAIEPPPIILIDRPALLLPDLHYPTFLLDCLQRLEAHLNQCWILDYQWNAPLYPPSHAPR
jgi:hypothetical protein